MKTLKNITLFLLVMLFPLVSFTQEENADAVYNKLVKEYVLNDDGTMEYHYYKELKLLTHFAFHRLFGETFIVYDPTYQELKINEAYTIMADGKKVVTPDNAFNEVLPRFARDIPSYNHLREMVVTHTGLEVGAVIVLDYTIITKDPFIPYLMGREAIGENVPVKEMEVTVKVPTDMGLTHKMLGLRTAPETQETRDGKSYTWTFRSLKGNSREAYQDPALAPRLLFSTAEDLPRAYYKFVDQMAFRYMASSLAGKDVKGLFTGDEDDFTKMRKLQELVLEEVKLVNIPLNHTGFKVRQPAETWQETNATSLEKALLLCEMLGQVDIKAIPVALIPNDEYDRSLGNLFAFEKFVVQVNLGDRGLVYVSVNEKNDQDLIYEMEGYTALQLDAAIESLRTFPVEVEDQDNEISLEGTLTLSGEEKLTGDISMELEGKLNPFFKILDKEEVVKSMLSGGVNPSSIKSFEVEDIDEEESDVEYTIEAESPLGSVGDYYTLTLPALRMDMHQYRLEGMSDTREEPLKLPVDIDEEYSYTIVIPEGWELLTPETDLVIENEAGELKIVILQKKNKIVVKKDIEINQFITPQQYNGFLYLVRTWVDERYSQLVLEAGR